MITVDVMGVCAVAKPVAIVVKILTAMTDMALVDVRAPAMTELEPIRHGVVVPVARRAYPQRGTTLDAATLDMLRESIPPNTRAAYDQAWTQWVRWCEEYGRCWYPATGQDLANHVTHLTHTPTKAGKLRAPSSLWITVASVRTYHRLVAAFTGDNEVQPPDSALAGTVIRTYGKRYAKAGGRPAPSDALTHRELKLIIPHIDLKTPVGVRDRAIFLLGHGHKSRRTELCTLDIADIKFTHKGMYVYLAMSKTDQAGRGASNFLPFGNHPETCRVTAVRELVELMASRGITSGPLLQRVDLLGQHFAGEPGIDVANWTGGTRGTFSIRMTGNAVYRVVEKYRKLAGLQGKYTPHSLRSGGLEDDADAGADNAELCDGARYSPNSTMPQRYVRRAKRERDPAMSRVDL